MSTTCARLGLDAYRVHVWDSGDQRRRGQRARSGTTMSMPLITASKLEQRGIRSILTPLQFGNAAYPEPGVPLEGSAARYGKQGSLGEPRVVAATGALSRPVREPHESLHRSRYAKTIPTSSPSRSATSRGTSEYAPTVEYINRSGGRDPQHRVEQPDLLQHESRHPGRPGVLTPMSRAERSSGTRRISLRAMSSTAILPYVDDYPIPFASNPEIHAQGEDRLRIRCCLTSGARYAYPAMARTFRKAGMQFATHPPTTRCTIAPQHPSTRRTISNLAYAPQKAIRDSDRGGGSRRVPRHEDYGAHPGNTRFEGVRVSYAAGSRRVL